MKPVKLKTYRMMFLTAVCILLFSMQTFAAKPSWFKLKVKQTNFIVSETYQLQYKNTKSTTYTFKSSNAKVMKVTKRSGLMKAKAKGKAVITVTAKHKTSKGSSVYQKSFTVYVSEISLNKTQAAIRQSEQVQLKVKGCKYLDERTVIWESSNEAAAHVSQTGLVSAVGEGEALITVHVGEKRSLSCRVTVSAVHLPDCGSIVLINTNGAYGFVSLISMMQEQMQAPYGNFTCTISDPTIGTVVNGMYHAYQEGTNTIDAKCGPYVKRFIVQSKKWNAHRGYMDIRPENTIDAYVEAARAGAYSMEADVRFTADMVPLLLHDRDLTVMTNGKGYLDDLTYEEAKTLSVVKGNGLALCSDRHIPTVDEYLRICKQYGVIAVLDVKKMHVKESQIKEQCLIIYEAAKRAGMLDQTMILSSYPENLEAFRSICGNRMICGAGYADSITLTQSGVPGITYYRGNELGISEFHDVHPILPVQGKNWRDFRSGSETE